MNVFIRKFSICAFLTYGYLESNLRTTIMIMASSFLTQTVFAVALAICAVSDVHCRPRDWLIDTITTAAEATLGKNGSSLLLTNGLISREFALTPDFGTIDFRSESSGKSVLRAIFPEAFITLDGTRYAIGGLQTNLTHPYLNRSSLTFSVNPDAFHYVGYTIGSPKAPFHWEPGLRHSPSNVSWPPEGVTLQVKFKAPPNVTKPHHALVTLLVNYEMYVGVPVIAKWVSMEYNGLFPIRVDGITVEYLATQKPYAPFSYASLPLPWYHDDGGVTGSWLYVETNQPHGTRVSWENDPAFGLSPGADEPLLNCSYSSGPGVFMYMGMSATQRQMKVRQPKSPPLIQFDSFRVLELLTDSADRERVGLSRNRMTRLLTPQTQENPIFFHCTNTTPEGFKVAVDQMASVGFEMFIFSFGSGFYLESTNASYIEQIAVDVQYAKAKGIEVGGYDLICEDRGHGDRNVGDQWDVVEPDSGQLGSDACFASGWYDKLNNIIFNFINKTGLSMLETDGPYGRAPCAATYHSHHFDQEDSVYWQTRLQGKMYSDLKELNIFINQPDRYFHQGGNKVGMGYDEHQYNLPRWEDLSVSRQGMFDDTFHFLPTQGWMFVPIVVYHGGGAAAEFEPLSQHLLEYEWALAQYLGYGVAACYRGPHLFDSPETEQVVRKWVSFYKTYRDILISDIIHVRRPDMQDIDCILHVNPLLENRGLAMVFNPTSSPLSHNLSLPLYYTGITSRALLLREGQEPGVQYTLERDYSIAVPVDLGAKSITWYLVKSAD